MKKNNTYTFSKKWINRLMWLFIIWISLTYVLAFMGRVDVAESLSETVMDSGVVLFCGYMLKAFFETFAEENLKYKKERDKVDLTQEVESEEGDI